MPRQRNCGLNAASGAIVAFTDDDVIVDPGWLTAFARRFSAHPEEVGVGGLILPKELETQAQITLEEYYGSMGPRILQPVSHRLEHAAGPATVIGTSHGVVPKHTTIDGKLG